MRSWYYSLFYADQNLLWSKDSMGDLLERLEYITEIQEGTIEILNREDVKTIAKALKSNKCDIKNDVGKAINENKEYSSVLK